MVASDGLEPSRPFGPQILSLLCLPIPPRGHAGWRFYSMNFTLV
jgi:hypothetical protein